MQHSFPVCVSVSMCKGKVCSSVTLLLTIILFLQKTIKLKLLLYIYVKTLQSGKPPPAWTYCILTKGGFRLIWSWPNCCKPNLKSRNSVCLLNPNWELVSQKRHLESEGAVSHSTFKEPQVNQHSKSEVLYWGDMLFEACCKTFLQHLPAHSGPTFQSYHLHRESNSVHKSENVKCSL